MFESLYARHLAKRGIGGLGGLVGWGWMGWVSGWVNGPTLEQLGTHPGAAERPPWSNWASTLGHLGVHLEQLSVHPGATGRPPWRTWASTLEQLGVASGELVHGFTWHFQNRRRRQP